MSILYLDHASTTPCRPEVWDIMSKYALYDYGNPDSLHQLGRTARQAVEDAKQTISECLGCDKSEIFITSGGTESDRIALLDTAYANRHRGQHIIVCSIEHLAVLDICKRLETEGFLVTYLDVDEYGLVSPEQVANAIRDNTILVSVMHANNEVGTIQPISEISRVIKSANPNIILHTDAVQSIVNLKVNVQELGVDMLTFSAQKFYGPKGVGGLYVRNGTKIQSTDSRKKRKGIESGSLGVPLIVGMAQALRLAYQEIDDKNAQMEDSLKRVTRGLLSINHSRLNGHPIYKLPNIISISFLGVMGEDVVLRLDKLGICASTGSACTSGIVKPSHVLMAMGIPRDWALGTLRLSFGNMSEEFDPELLVKNISSVVDSLRSTNFRGYRQSSKSEFTPNYYIQVLDDSVLRA